MNVLKSQAEPDLIHILFTNYDAKELITALKKPKNETAQTLRKKLKEVTNNG